MDIVIRIRDTNHDGRDESPLDFLPAAEAAVASVKANRPIDDGVALVDIVIESDPEKRPYRRNKPYVDVAARDAAEAAEIEEARIARSEEQALQASHARTRLSYEDAVEDATFPEKPKAKRTPKPKPEPEWVEAQQEEHELRDEDASDPEQADEDKA